MDQLETGHPKRLVEEAHHRMLTRTPIRYGAALAVSITHERNPPTTSPFRRPLRWAARMTPGLTVRLRPGALLSSDDFRVERRANGEASSVMADAEFRGPVGAQSWRVGAGVKRELQALIGLNTVRRSGTRGQVALQGVADRLDPNRSR
jgi:hypothetical protein